MRVLVACEFSGRVRRAFEKLGHEAWSCDLLPAEDFSPRHRRADVLDVLTDAAFGIEHWDLMIAHPPCTYLAVSGARWWKDRVEEQQEAVAFVRYVAAANIPRIAIENPVGHLSTAWRKPDQIVQPWQFGHPETKATCLWLKNLPPLQPTHIVEGRAPRCHHEGSGRKRWKHRSRTLEGIAAAMAEQWGGLNG